MTLIHVSCNMRECRFNHKPKHRCTRPAISIVRKVLIDYYPACLHYEPRPEKLANEEASSTSNNQRKVCGTCDYYYQSYPREAVCLEPEGCNPRNAPLVKYDDRSCNNYREPRTPKEEASNNQRRGGSPLKDSHGKLYCEKHRQYLFYIYTDYSTQQSIYVCQACEDEAAIDANKEPEEEAK